MSFQLPELLIILVIAILVFGPKNLPPISRNGGPPDAPTSRHLTTRNIAWRERRHTFTQAYPFLDFKLPSHRPVSFRS